MSDKQKRWHPCHGCGESAFVEALLKVVCQGCGMVFQRCEGCFRKFAGCSDECRRLSRKALEKAWDKPAPIDPPTTRRKKKSDLGSLWLFNNTRKEEPL